ncbi:hypothetical protein L3X38_033059 [Prunus dulcis]|uniref:Reverse transcriptase Ty1/copia-type domain-containing protein n=1 Tax=Prunus dulcis TaxID=3755 RepID=A0AAD4VHC9_PRUDU|nr:hypothetical protein L3X38_033059 [Prunus dulcis]
MCRFVGYPKETLGYYFYHPNEQKVFVARSARFLEIDFALDGTYVQKIKLKEESGEPHEPKVESDPADGLATLPTLTQPPRRSKRINKVPDMYANQVRTLVDPPEGIVPIENKWVFKRKKGSHGKVEAYKARLIAKGYRQRERIDYEETFTPIAMIKSIRILLAIATYYDYEIWQMDVKMAFLNGHLQEEIYIDQPEGFISKHEEKKVCNSNESDLDDEITELGVVPSIESPVILYYDNNGAIAQAKAPRSRQRSKHIRRRYPLIREYVADGDISVLMLASANNVADLVTQSMSQL